MPAKSKQALVNRTLKEDNALQRLLCLPVVNSACNSLQKTYTTTKESHPLVASVCEAYERGIQAASSLVMWSMKPVIQKLEPRFAAANVLACQGLDHLEQRIPTLHKPVEEVTSELKDSICTHVQSTVHSIADALDWILGLAADSCEQAQNTMRDVTKDARSSKVSHLAEAGVETALGKVEKLVDLLLPKPEHSSDHDNSGAHVLREGSPSSVFGRIRAVACSVSQHAYRQTTQTIQYTSSKGQEWAMWIPGVTEESAQAQSLLGSLTQNLQAASLSTISGMKEAQFTACNAAGQLLSPHRAVSEMSTKVGTLWGILQNVTGSFLGTVFHYVPVPRLLVKAEGTATVMADGSETYQQQKSSQPVVTDTQEKGPHYQRRGDWRSNRGHHPLSFLNLDEPHLAQQAPFQRRSLAFEADYTSAHKSAFSPYKEAASSRRLSEGLYRSSPEPVYSKAHYTGLYGTILKKD